MRIVYLDEAGTANKEHEPFLVVAGIIVDPDWNYAPIDKALRNLSTRCFPDGDGLPAGATAWGKPFVFHAKDIWHGSGLFPRAQWPLEDRMDLLRELSEIPKRFGLTVVWGAIDRKEHAVLAKERGLSAKEIESDAHALAFLIALRKIDRWMVEKAFRERAIVFAEDRGDVRSAIEQIHSICTDRSIEDAPDEAFISSHIVEPVAFIKKQSSPLLQIADHCSFIVKRRLQSCPKILPYFDNLSFSIWEEMSDGESLITRIPLDSLAPLE